MNSYFSHKRVSDETKKVSQSPTPNPTANQITKKDLILDDDEKDSKPKAENRKRRSRKERRKKAIEKDKNRNDWNDPIVYRPPIVKKKSTNLLNISSSSSSSSMPSYDTESRSTSSSSSHETNTTQPTTTVTTTSIQPQTNGDTKDESSSLSSSRSRSRSSSSSYSPSPSPRDNPVDNTPRDKSHSIPEKTIQHSLSNDALNSFLLNNPDIVNQVDRIVKEEKANSKQLTKLNDLVCYRYDLVCYRYDLVC
jgi:hypothetical protein